MKTNNYFYELPEGYICVKTIDAKEDKKFMVLMTVVNFLLLAIIFGLGLLIILKLHPGEDINISPFIVLIACAAMFVYIILHELTHGLFYKIFTHEKLTFGLTLLVAFCGVPKLYVNRKTSLITTLAPFVIFNIIYILLMLLIPDLFTKIVVLFMFAMHFGGCVGDLWVAYYLLFKHRDKKILVNDTGPKQTFYIEGSNDGNQVS
ncbi:MAG: DUF3267 domain-containing protein [Bacilli bacterium]|nr:DUF3267 domain-containing protein [Bacilli bacterium]